MVWYSMVCIKYSKCTAEWIVKWIHTISRDANRQSKTDMRCINVCEEYGMVWIGKQSMVYDIVWHGMV